MEVYLYECEEFQEIVLKVPQFKFYFGSDQLGHNDLQLFEYTPLFWKEIRTGKAKLTKIGEF